MQATIATLSQRLRALERARTRGRVAFAGLLLSVTALAAAPPQEPDIVEELLVRELVLVDDAGTPRVRLGSERDTQRRDAWAGVTLFDDAGDERGGLGTFADGSVLLALDAPAGVGAPMRDRAAISVAANGSASVWLIDNTTGVPVRLVTDPEGGGGLEFLTYDLERREFTVTRQDAEGTSRSVRSLGD
jgi:hypothetical protein